MPTSVRNIKLLKSISGLWMAAVVGFTGCQNLHNILTLETDGLPPSSAPLTVMSYNIRVGYGAKDRGVDPYLLSKRQENLEPIIAAIQSVEPDIIGLQEVRGSGQARRLAQALDMNYAYAWHETDSARARWWGVAILSKYPIKKAKRVLVRSGSGNMKSALVCTADIGGLPATFISVHTVRDRRDWRSFAEIMKVVDKIPHPVVLIGDLNMQPHDQRLELLQSRFVDSAVAVDTESAKNARATGTFEGIGRIDYVLVDNRYFDVQEAGIISRKYWNASDHLAYFARIILRPLP